MYYTKAGQNISNRIKEGRTQIVKGICFTSEQIAQDLARQKGSYHDELFGVCENTGNRVQIGFIIPG